MPNTPTPSEGAVACPLCKTPFERAVLDRCPLCGADATYPAFDQLIEADQALETCQTNYDDLISRVNELNARWAQWQAHRAALVPLLAATRDPSFTHATVAPHPDDQPTPASADATVAAAPSSPPAAVPAAQPIAASTVPAATARDAAPAPYVRPQVERSTPKVLTAPALLGVSGASLLIAAAVVFVAMTWETFNPVVRAGIMLVVAAAVAYLSLWLKRLTLEISSGAVGVVSMGFVGVAGLALGREALSLGSYDAPVALVVTCLAGLVLSRVGITWVGSTAALALAGAAVGFTVAARQTTGAGDPAGVGLNSGAQAIWAWTIVGTFVALMLAATYSLWKGPFARASIKWGSLVWLAIVGFALPVAMWFRYEGTPVDLALALLPVAALGVLARWWAREAVGPAAVLVTLIAPSAVHTFGGTGWQQITSISVVIAVMLAAGRWAPKVIKAPLLIGLSPAFVVVFLSSSIYTVSLLIVRILAGTYVPDTQIWAGVAALVAGVSLGLLRLWDLTSVWIKTAYVAGAAMLVSGVGLSAFGVAEQFLGSYHTAVALSLTGGALALVASLWLYAQRAAQWVSGIGAAVFLTVAGFHASWALRQGELPFVWGLLVALVPLVILVVSARWWPRVTLSAAALLFTVVTAGISAHFGVGNAAIGAITMAAVAALLWGGVRLPATWKPLIALGLTPAFAWGLGTAVWTAFALLARIGGGSDFGALDIWSTLTATLVATALAALPHWKLPKLALSTTSMVGAIVIVIAASSMAFAIADAVGTRIEGALAISGAVAALVAAAFTALWTTSSARWANGIGATVVMTISGLNAAFHLGDPSTTLWVAVLISVLPVVLLALFARWWPRVTLGPAAFLATAVAAAVAYRVDWADAAALALALVVAAVVMWVATRLHDTHRVPLIAGLAPALGAGVLVGAGVLLGGFGMVLAGQEHQAIATEMWWLGGASVMLATAFGAVRAMALGTRLTSAISVAGTLATAAGAVAVTVATGATMFDRFEPAASMEYGAAYREARSIAMAQSHLWVILAAIVTSILVATTVRVWTSGSARLTVRIAATTWLTVAGVRAMVDLQSHSTSQVNVMPWAAGIGLVALVAALLGVAAKWWPRVTFGPFAFVVSIGAWAAVSGLGAGMQLATLSTAVALAILAWFASRWARESAAPILLGLVPAVIVVAATLLGHTVTALGRYSDELLFKDADHGFGWPAVTAVVAYCALLAWPRARNGAGWIAVPFVALASGFVPVLWAWIGLLVLAAVAMVWRRVLRVSPEVAIVLAVIAMGWSVGASWSLAITAAGATAIAWWAVVDDASAATRVWALLSAPFLGGIAVANAVLAWGLGSGLAVVFAMAAIMAIAIVLARMGHDAGLQLTPWTVALSTALVPVFAPSLTYAGVALLVAGAAWLALAVLTWKPGRFFSAAVLSLGTALIMADANISVIEAYTAVPAITVLGIGLWWMYEEPRVHSLRALGFGLALALVPSYVALVLEPDSLLRTIILTSLTIMLALAGVMLKWFAPILATTVTALVVSVAQLVVGSNMVVRLISFAVVGSILLAIASTFEKLKQLR
ncbi:MAG: hypothetical protein CVT64_10820 [Actinobacteria bacterium HGW-Actinobacteria-4]|nr:MAG: hypothetical protein CVT64_10820 [Actinobacteria bacterium HGW-Actinobacteria-4]